MEELHEKGISNFGPVAPVGATTVTAPASTGVGWGSRLRVRLGAGAIRERLERWARSVLRYGPGYGYPDTTVRVYLRAVEFSIPAGVLRFPTPPIPGPDYGNRYWRLVIEKPGTSFRASQRYRRAKPAARRNGLQEKMMSVDDKKTKKQNAPKKEPVTQSKVNRSRATRRKSDG